MYKQGTHTFTLLVESAQLLEAKHKCVVVAGSLEEVVAELIVSLDLPCNELKLEMLDSDSKEYKALKTFSQLSGISRARVRLSPSSLVMHPPDNLSEAAPSAYRLQNTGPWTRQEKESFEVALEQVGKDFKRMVPLIPTRSIVQIRSHAQKYFAKAARDQQKLEMWKAQLASLQTTPSVLSVPDLVQLSPKKMSLADVSDVVFGVLQTEQAKQSYQQWNNFQHNIYHHPHTHQQQYQCDQHQLQDLQKNNLHCFSGSADVDDTTSSTSSTTTICPPVDPVSSTQESSTQESV
jgi:SHAQKYF class myb-like DNA-binding protein